MKSHSTAQTFEHPQLGQVTLRRLQPSDREAFIRYLAGLSEQTRRWWGPHGYDSQAAANVMAALGGDRIIRLVAVLPDGEIAAYFLLYIGARASDSQRFAALGLPLDDATDCALAPSVADAWQNMGLGPRMMQYAIETARRCARRRIVLWDGVQALNTRAIRFYSRSGFRKVGSFQTDVENYDMILDLEDAG